VEVEQLADVMRSLQHEMQDVELTLHSRSSPALIAELQERRLDAAFIRPSPQAAGLSMEIVRSEPLIAALPAGHRLARKRRLSAVQLQGAPLVDVMQEHAPVLYAAIQAYAARSGIELTWTYKADNLMLALSLVRTAGAVSLLPEHARALFPPGVVGVALEEDAPTIELALAWHPENTSVALRRFRVDFLALSK
jgi:LysR family hca operon transcriptional activator